MSLPNPIVRTDYYLKKIADPTYDGEMPNAITRTDYYLKEIADNAGGGGMLTSTMYSLTERVVGYWYDGKPLYQITITFNTPITITNSGWTTVISEWIQDIGIIASCEAIGSSSSTCSTIATILEYNRSTHELKALGQNGSNSFDTLTIRYTKTSD